MTTNAHTDHGSETGLFNIKGELTRRPLLYQSFADQEACIDRQTDTGLCDMKAELARRPL